MWQQLMPALRITLVMTVLTGLLYPGLVTGLSRLLFPTAAAGSLIVRNGHVIGSSLIGQAFKQPRYFHPRPSAAGDGYDGTASGGSNFGPTSAKLKARVKAAVTDYRAENLGYSGEIPPDAVLASASGLDPHISPANAEIQVDRVAQARGVPADQMRQLVNKFLEDRELGFLGEPRINVLKLNLALDEKFPAHK